MKVIRTIPYAPRLWRSMLLVTLVGLALALAWWGTHLAPTQAQDSGSITIHVDSQARQGDPQTGFPIREDGRDRFVVTITLEGGECPAVQREIPVDAVLVIDTSSSMDDTITGSTSKLDATKQAALTFIQQFNLVPGSTSSDQIAVVAFNSSASIASNLTSDVTVLQNAINGLSTGGGTDIASALTQATDILASASANFQGGAQPVIVLLSDGRDNAPDAVLAEAERARRLTGASIITVGVGDPSDIDEDMLRDIADSTDDAHLAESAGELTALYERIARAIQPTIVAENLVITYTVNGEYFQIVDNTSEPNAVVGANTLQWTLVQVNSGEQVELQTEIRGLYPVSGASVGTVTVDYLPCGQPTAASAIGIGPIVTILQVTQTPAPTNTPTVTPSPTSTITPTPTLNAVLRDPGPAEPIGGTTSMGVDFCEPGWWDWLWLIFLILALLWLLWVLWTALRNWRAGRYESFWQFLFCWLPWRLFVFVLLLLLYLLLEPLAGALCDVPESVYFWRMNGNQRGVFLTHDDLDVDEPAQVTSLNETSNCVGCHFVSSEAQIVGAIIEPVPNADALRMTEFDGDLVDDVPAIDAMYGAFSPDGRKLAVTTSSGELVVFDRDTPLSGWQLITGASDEQYAALMPAWTSDGLNIAFVRAARGTVHSGLLVEGSQSDIYMIAADPAAVGAMAVPVAGASENDGLNYYPAFSPDGRWLAFTHSQGNTTYSSPEAEIWLLNLATGDAGAIAGNTPNASNSWSTWNRDGTKLAFNTTAYDPNFDIVVVDVYESGATSAARKLRGAAQPGVFEHLPYWGEPIDQVGVWDELKGQPWLWPLLCLVPLVLMLLLCWLRKSQPTEELPDLPPVQPPREPLKPDDLPQGQLLPLWKPRGALVIGLGNPGWHVLAQLKKTLADAELGDPSKNVRLLCVLNGDQARQLDRETDTLKLDQAEVVEWQENLMSLAGTVNDDPLYKGWIDRQTMQELRSAADPKVGFQNRRIMGRLALLNNLRQYPPRDREQQESGAVPGEALSEDEALSLWSQLETAARAVQKAERELQKNDPEGLHDPSRLHVLLVTDLSDDVGSGAFLDVAYLVRQLQQHLGLADVQLVGHLLTDRAAHGLQRSDLGRQTSTIAALRETERFQLSAGVPLSMMYSRDPGQRSEIDGNWESSLFDEVFVYDGERRPAMLSNVDPRLGIYPALADSIAVWLDTAANRGGLDGWRNATRAATTSTQLQTGHMTVGSLGLYQIRLPFADLLEDITVRYARRVLQILLMGDSPEMPQYKMELVTENIPGKQTPQTLVAAFLSEQLGSPGKSDWQWRQVFQSKDADTLRKAARKLRIRAKVQDKYEVEAEAGSKGRGRENPDNEIWQQWLVQVVRVLLNGQSALATDPVDPVRRRGAKLGLVKAFLDALAGSGGDGALSVLAQQIANVGGVDHDQYEAIVLQLKEFARIAREYRDQVVAVGDALGMGAKQESLYGNLTARYDKVIARWSHLENLHTREYITKTPPPESEPLREVWYDIYMREPVDQEVLSAVEKGVRQLHWEVGADLSLALVLNLPKMDDDDPKEGTQITFDPDPEKVDEFANSLVQLGRYFARLIPEREGLAKFLNLDQLSDDNITETVNQLMRNSGPMLGTDEQAVQHRPGIVLSAHSGIKRVEELKRRLLQHLPDEDRLKRLETTDPFSLTLMQTADALTVNSISSLQRAHETYLSQMGLAGRDVVTHPERVAVFEAEATALEYERQLLLIKKPRQQFHPVVVAGLANRVKAETYLLAAVIGDNTVLIPASELENLSVGALMEGLLRFVGYYQTADGAWHPRISETFAQEKFNQYWHDDDILEALDTWEMAGGESWLARYATAENEMIIDNLIAITRILIVNIFKRLDGNT
ncbi:MAG: VWA domain-containing protein [Anaerolineae bacterium]|nr:VWA domain-containing protein [Anaerolineae bacterium]